MRTRALFERDLTLTHKIVERSGKKIGITAVVGDEWLSGVKSDEVLKRPAAEALAEVLPKLQAAGV